MREISRSLSAGRVRVNAMSLKQVKFSRERLPRGACYATNACMVEGDRLASCVARHPHEVDSAWAGW